MNDILKPCPFCGSTKIRVTNPVFWYAWCSDCRGQTGANGTRQDAIDAWNRRSDEQKLERMYDTLVGLCEDIRERYGQDDVCGLCQYDGAYMTDSGDYANECPGFERDDCFCMKNEIRELCGVERIPEPYENFEYDPVEWEDVEDADFAD